VKQLALVAVALSALACSSGDGSPSSDAGPGSDAGATTLDGLAPAADG
jgi:hypothetical protein